jgi:putative cell wall-binding protein
MSDAGVSVGRTRLVVIGLSVAMAVLVCAFLSLFMAAPALAAPEYASLRGTDRYDTAIKISQAGFAAGVEGVVLATGENFPDALAAAPLAAAYGGPLLLTHSSYLDETTRAEIVRLQPQTIFVVGLEAAVVTQVAAAFPELAATPERIVRLVGLNRYDTARLVAEQVHQRTGDVSGAVLVPGDSFADALSVGPLAAAKGWPVLLTPTYGPLPEETAAALQRLQPASLLAVGTTVDPGLPAAVTRIIGSDRYATCVQVAAYALDQGLSISHVGLVTGQKFPDGLAAAPYLALRDGLLLLTQDTSVSSSVAQFLVDHAADVVTATFIGLNPGVVTLAKLLLSDTDLPDGFGSTTVASGASGAAVLWLEQKLALLSYRPGPVDGVFDKRTHQAVLAFQKWEGLARDGVVGPQVWARLLTAKTPQSARSSSGSWVEVNKSKQVLLYVERGVVTRTLAVSTGNANVGIVTPSGTYSITRRSGGWDGPRYKPLYLRSWGALAIHGYPSVPVWPASHGCVRVPLWDQDELYPLIPVGTRVFVY